MFHFITKCYNSSKKRTCEKNESSITKLNIDCWEHILDYTSLSDLNSLAQTCKRMQAITGYYFKTHHPNRQAYYNAKNIYIDGLKSNVFLEYISNVSIWNAKLKDFHFIGSSNFNLLRSIDFVDGSFSAAGSKSMAKILKKIECVRLWVCRIPQNGDLYDKFLKWCPNLRSLKIHSWQRGEFIIGTNNNWLRQKYPMLERIEFNTDYSIEVIGDLKIFLEQNPNLKMMTMNIDFFRIHWELLMETECKLQTMMIVEIYGLSPLDTIRLNALYERGFYERLRLGFRGNVEDFNDIRSIQAVEMVKLISVDDDFKVLKPIHLKEIEINIKRLMDFELFIRNVVGVERLVLFEVEFDHLMCILRNLKMVKEIACKWYGGSLIDLRTLNEVREKVRGACRVTIFVKENIYLATKWTFGQEYFNKVSINRLHCFDDK